jgi:hypothetical protein
MTFLQDANSDFTLTLGMPTFKEPLEKTVKGFNASATTGRVRDYQES